MQNMNSTYNSKLNLATTLPISAHRVCNVSQASSKALMLTTTFISGDANSRQETIQAQSQTTTNPDFTCVHKCIVQLIYTYVSNKSRSWPGQHPTPKIHLLMGILQSAMSHMLFQECSSTGIPLHAFKYTAQEWKTILI